MDNTQTINRAYTIKQIGKELKNKEKPYKIFSLVTQCKALSGAGADMGSSLQIQIDQLRCK